MNELPLGGLLEVVIDHRGKTPRKLGGDFTDAGVPVISAIHIKNGVIEWSERERYVSQEMFARWMPQRLRKGDVLLTSEAPLGEAALVPSDADLVLSQRLFALRGKAGVLNSAYLRYFLASEVGQRRLKDRATGTTVLGIRQSELLKVLVPLPPLAEQERIAQTLGALDGLIDVNRALIADLRGLVRSTYRAALGGASLVSAADLIDLKYGKALPAKGRVPGRFPVVSSAGIVDSHQAPLVTGPGVVVGRKGTVGSVTWVDNDFYPIDTAFYVKTTLPMLYVFLVLESLGLDKMNTDSAVPGLNRENALRRTFPLLPEGDLAGLMGTIQPLWDAAQALEAENHELAATRDELLPLIISGRVRVGDVAA